MGVAVPSLYVEIITTPEAKGSVSGFPIMRKNGKMGVSITHSRGSKRFEKIIREAVADKRHISGAVVVEAWFYVKRPATVTRTYPSVPKDVDKLIRTVLDGLNENWEDDSRVVDLHTFKRYATDDIPPGVWIYVRSKNDSELQQEQIRNEVTRKTRLAHEVA